MMMARRPQVLMLGWEYPPRLAGGLGKACRGLSVALAECVDLTFVLPSFPEELTEPGLSVLNARESLSKAGVSLSRLHALEATQVYHSPVSAFSSFTPLQSAARLFPYGAPPPGPRPQWLREILEVEGPGSRKEHGQQEVLPEEVPSVQTPIYGQNLWEEIEKFTLSVRALADARQVDLIHAHDWMTFPAAFAHKRVSGAPVFLHVHATEFDRSGEENFRLTEIYRIEVEAFAQADHIFAVSAYTKTVLQEKYGVAGDRITVVHNAPDEEVIRFLRHPSAPRRRDVVFLGRLTFQKGPGYFLKAAAEVAEVDREVRFIFCGTGDLLPQLELEVEELGLRDRVEFRGFVDPDSVNRILERSRVLVMPSVSEPFGLVALEAIRCGLPAILSRQSGVREVIPHALEVDFWDYERLADQILALLKHPHLSAQLVNEGFSDLRRLSWRNAAAKVIESYEGIQSDVASQFVHPHL